jgi:antitoxin component YwqK of YwqJK toxin-antitoxin module
MHWSVLATLDRKLKGLAISASSFSPLSVISLVPPELWLIILTYCDLESYRALGEVSPLFYDLVTDPFIQRSYCLLSLERVEAPCFLRARDENYYYHHLDGTKCGPACEPGKINIKEGVYLDGKREGPWLSVYPDGSRASHVSYVNGQRHGYYVRFYATGRVDTEHSPVAEEGDYLHGKRVGVWRTFYPTGEKSEERMYVNDEAHGHSRGFHPSGSLRFEGQYGGGKKFGLWRLFYFHSAVREEGAYEGDKRVGLWRFYHRNGLLEREGGYCAKAGEQDSSRTGFWRFCYETGELRKSGIFRRGRKSGLWNFYRPDKSLTAQILYEKGRPEEKMLITRSLRGGEETAEPEEMEDPVDPSDS